MCIRHKTYTVRHKKFILNQINTYMYALIALQLISASVISTLRTYQDLSNYTEQTRKNVINR